MPAVDDRMKLTGEFWFPAPWGDLRVRGRADLTLPRIGWLRARILILRDAWTPFRDQLRWLMNNAVQDWAGGTYEDLWRDPELAFRLYRSVRKGAACG